MRNRPTTKPTIIAHKNGAPDTSSAISGGNDTGQPSEITIIGNLIYDCDHAALAKQGNFYTLLNNTIAILVSRDAIIGASSMSSFTTLSFPA